MAMEESGGAVMTACGERGSGCGGERGSCGHGCMWRERGSGCGGERGVMVVEEREGAVATVMGGSQRPR
ncbi:hypothetical protein OIU85_028227 [Salix viminalis]|uniref:Uncharacterized protein n=1 Tax=Salix viminalis TaxID=40686 RepID=A0A9Q0QKF3_SALVM|nr:hypothetical protein OIU85_028227 [Salix viminalis]